MKSKSSKVCKIVANAKRNWPVLAIITVWIFFCYQFFFKGLVPFPSDYLVSFFAPWNAEIGIPVKNSAMPDVITQIYPWKRVAIDTWKAGQIPLWNPFSFSGTVHAANYQSAVFSPFNLLFLFFSFINAWSLLVLLQPLLAGIFMYIFLKGMKLNNLSVFLGSISFMFCGFIVGWMAYGTLGMAVLFLPLLFHSVNSYFQKNNWTSGVLLSLSLAISFLSGHFQISLYVFIAVFLYFLYKLFKKRSRKNFLLVTFFLAGLMLASPQLLITYKAYINSVRSLSFIKAEIIPWQNLVTLFAPDYFGNPVTRNDWFGHWAEWASYIGVVGLFFAVFAIVKNFGKNIKFYLGLFIFSILLSHKSPLIDLMFALKIPAISTSAASRIIVLASFSLAVIAAFGFSDYIKDLKKKNKKFLIRTIIFFIFLICLNWLVLFFLKPYPADELLVAKRNSILPTAIIIAVSFMSLILFYLKRNKKIVFIIILLAAVFDMWRFSSKWMPFEQKMHVYPDTPLIRFLKENAQEERVFGNIYNEVGSTFGISLIEGYDAMYQARYGRFIGFVDNKTLSSPARSVVEFPKNGIYKEKALNLLGVKFIVYRKSDLQNVWSYPVWEYDESVLRRVYSNEHYEVYENLQVFPRAYLASDYQVLTNEEDILKILFSPEFPIESKVILEENPRINLDKGEGSVKILSYTPNKVVFETNSQKNKLLFISDVFDTGWKASIDGAKSKVYRANYVFRAISVPSGSHIIEMYYWPNELTWGFMFFVAGVIYLIFGNKIIKLL